MIEKCYNFWAPPGSLESKFLYYNNYINYINYMVGIFATFPEE